jgi:hypothetical protein
METGMENTDELLKRQRRKERAREIEAENRTILRKGEIRKYHSRGFIQGIPWVVRHMISRGRVENKTG